MEVPNDLTFDIQDPKPAPQPVSPIEPPIMAPPQEPAFVPQMTAGQLLALEDIAAGQQQQQRDLELFRQAVTQNPEMHAKKVRLAGELGLDPNDPDQDWKIAEEASRQKQAEAVAFNQKYPHLASRMKEYDFAAQAFDDLENLQKIEGLWQYMTENYSRGKMMVERGQIGTRIAMGWSTQADLDRLEEMRKVPRLPKMDGLLYGVAGGTSEFIGQMGQTIPTSLAAAGTAAAVGAVAPPLAVISAPTAFLLSSGAQTAVIEGGNAYLDYLDSGYGEEEARNAALGVGIINGAAETVLGKFALKPFQQLGGRLGSKVMPKVFKPQTATTSLGQAAVAYLKGVGAEVGTEVFQEIVQIAGGEAAKAFSRPELDQLMATPQGRQQMYDRIGEIASKTVLSMMVLGLPGPMANFVSDMQRAEQANIDTQVLTALQNGTNDSRLTERNPELARQFQEQVQGEAVNEVYINADTLRSRLTAIDEAATAEGKLQKSAFDVLRDLLPDVSKQLEGTVANSDAIVIKTSELTTKLGRSEMLSVLMDDIRIDPNGMSKNEEATFSPQIQKRAGEMRKSISKKAEEDKAWRESANRVRDMQAQQIQQAGRSAMEARVAGTLYSIIAQRMAMLEGVTPEQWHATRGMTTAPLGEQAAPAVQPPAWLSQMAAPAQAQPTQEAALTPEQAGELLTPEQAAQQLGMTPEQLAAAAEEGEIRRIRSGEAFAYRRGDVAALMQPQAAPTQPTVQPLDQAKTLLADPNAQITPEQRAELEQYVQQSESQTLRSFIGPNSIQNLPQEQQQFMQDSLAAADAMAIAGKDNETIRTLTGWFVGLDGRWKFEIPDQEAELTWDAKTNIASRPKVMRLDEILDHEALYIAYPQLRNVLVDVALTGEAIFDGKPVAGYGVFYDKPVYDPATASLKGETHIKVRVKDNETLLSVLLHEVQHAIQHLEGVDLSDNNTKYASRSVEIEARNVQVRQRYTRAQRLSEPPFVKNGWSNFRNVDLNDAVVVDAVPPRTKTAGRDLAGITQKTDVGTKKATESTGYFLKYVYGPASNAATAKRQADAGLVEAYVPVINGTPEIMVNGWARAFTSEAAAMKEGAALSERSWRRRAQKSVGVQRVLVNNANPVLLANEQDWQEYLRNEFGDRYNVTRFTDAGLTGIVSGDAIFVPDSSQIDISGETLRSRTPFTAEDAAYLAAVEAGDMETAQRMVDEAAKKAGVVSFDEEFPTYSSMVQGVRDGKVLIHARKLSPESIEDLKYGLEPTIGETLASTEAVQTSEEFGRPEVPLVFASDTFKWVGNTRNGVIFVRANTFQKSLGDGRVQLANGSIVKYEKSPIADYENEGLRSEPAGVETNDWYSTKIAEVVGVSTLSNLPSDPVTRDAAGNVIPLSQRFDRTKDSTLYSQQPEAGVGGTYSRLMRKTVLNPDARETTWYHELMHFMFDTHADMIARNVATDQMRADFMELLRFAGFNGTMEEYLALPSEKQRVIHETIAYSWESWLLEGKSPSDAVASIFKQILKFFVEVWKQLSAINAAYRIETGQDLPGMTDNVRAVFGRMVASEDQIKLAEATRAAVPLFLDKETWTKMGNPAEDWDKYQAAERRRIDEAVVQLTRKGIESLVRLQGSNDQRMAQLNKEAMALREELREQATAEVALERVMRTREFLETGRVVNEAGEVIEEKAKTHKLNREAIVQMPLAANVVETDLNQQVEAARMEHDAWMSQDIRPLMRMPEVRASGSANVKQTQKQITTTETKLSKLAADAPERAELQAKMETLRAELAKRTMVAEERSALEAQKEAIRAENEEIRKTNAEIDAGRRASKQKLEEALAAQAIGLRKIEAQKLRAAGKHKLSDFLDEEGMDPAQLADLFQYSDVAEMLTDLLTAPDREKAIEQEIDRRMLAEYSELATPEAMQEAVSASLANDHNTQWLTMELNALRRAQRMGDNRPEALQEQGDKQQLLADMRADLDALNNRLADEREASDMAAIAATQSEIKSLKESIAQVERDAEGALSMRIMRASARKAAEMVIANRTVRSVRPDLYAAAERRSSRDALAKLTNGDLAGAIAAKRDQLLQNQMVYEATQVRAFISRTTKWYNSLFKRGKKELNLARTRSMEYVNAIRAILLAYGFGESNETRANREARVRAQLAQLQQYEPARYAEINSMIEEITTSKKSYKDLTVQEFKRLNEQIRFLWAEAERDKSITSEGKRVQVAEVEDQIAQRAAELAPKGPRPGQEKAITPWERTIMTFQGIVSSMRRAQSLFDSWDGKLPGVFTKYFWRPIQYATVAYRAGRDAYHKQYVAILKELEPHLNKRVEDSWGITQKYINYRFDSMQSLVAMLTHIGNRSNKAKMTVGGRGKGFEWAVYDPETGNIDTSKFDAMIDELIAAGILTTAHFDAAQKIWNLNAAMLPDIQRVYRQKYGVFFEEVKPEAFTKTFPDGTKKTYAGGYVPAKTDRDLVYNMGDADAVADVEQTDKDSFPTTDWKFTIKRMERYMKPLDLDLSRQFQHIEAVQRFIHLQPALWDVARLIKSDRIQAAFDSIDPTVRPDMLMPWLERVASQRTGRSTSMPLLDKFIRGARNRAGMAIMFANLSNTVQQITGFSLALLKVKGSYLRGALRRLVLTSPAKRRKMFDEICERSKLMEQRFKTQIFDLQESMNDVLVNPSKYQKARSFAKRHAYFMQQHVQNLMDAVVWSASYEQSVAEGVSDAEAVMRADAAVTSTQGGTQPELISKFESGPEFMRVFTQFTNYFNMQFNLNYTEFQKILRDGGWRSNKGKLFTAWMTGAAVPMVAAGLIAQAFSGKMDDEDEDGYGDEVGSFVLDTLARGHLSMIPGGNLIAALTINRFDTEVYNDRMLNTPVTGALERGAGAFDLISAMYSEDKDVTGRRIRDAATLIDMIAGLPVSGIAGKVAYAIESMTGVQPNYNFADAVRGSLTGVAAPGNRQK